jgi:hypothetical protein
MALERRRPVASLRKISTPVWKTNEPRIDDRQASDEPGAGRSACDPARSWPVSTHGTTVVELGEQGTHAGSFTRNVRPLKAIAPTPENTSSPKMTLGDPAGQIEDADELAVGVEIDPLDWVGASRTAML